MTVNGVQAEGELTDDGYYSIDRKWKKGDKVEIRFNMEPRTVKAHPKVDADRGRVAIERGPIVYCAEWPDNNFNVLNCLVNQNPQFEVSDNSDMLGGVVILSTDAQILRYDNKGRLLTDDVRLNLIPYYAWCHRGSGNMSVWLPQEVSVARPVMLPTLASRTRIKASRPMPSLSSLNDGLLPRDENDRSIPYTYWPSQKGSIEWLTYELPVKSTISNSTVFWYDDSPWGGCRVPKSWRLYYKNDSGNWQPVTGADNYGVATGTGNTVNFDPMETTAVKLEVELPDDNTTGIFEWQLN